MFTFKFQIHGESLFMLCNHAQELLNDIKNIFLINIISTPFSVKYIRNYENAQHSIMIPIRMLTYYRILWSNMCIDRFEIKEFKDLWVQQMVRFLLYFLKVIQLSPLLKFINNFQIHSFFIINSITQTNSNKLQVNLINCIIISHLSCKHTLK